MMMTRSQSSATARLGTCINGARWSENASFAKFLSSLLFDCLSPFSNICTPLHRCCRIIATVVSFGVRRVRSVLQSFYHASGSSFEVLCASFQVELAACEENKPWRNDAPWHIATTWTVPLVSQCTASPWTFTGELLSVSSAVVCAVASEMHFSGCTCVPFHAYLAFGDIYVNC